VLEALGLQQREQLLLLGIGGGEAGLDQIESQAVEHVRHAQLLLGRERHALALHAVAQRGVVDEDAGHAVVVTGTTSSQSA
jgi:hypothetical protein